ncbi:MAG: hypothetical protein FJY85_04875, partial [Deltaproteobacteria bacterium]|nr:hypothetical protein [Deltaproteobacteria bacterium]
MLTMEATVQMISRIKNELADKEDLLRRQFMAMSDAFESDTTADELDKAQWATIVWHERAVVNNLHLQVNCLRRALQRIGTGTYGLCDDCGE